MLNVRVDGASARVILDGGIRKIIDESRTALVAMYNAVGDSVEEEDRQHVLPLWEAAMRIQICSLNEAEVQKGALIYEGSVQDY